MKFLPECVRCHVLVWILIPLGLVTAMVMAMPSLVVLGLFLMVIPGLVLAVIPTVFVYLLATFLVRLSLPIRSEMTANLLAFMITLGLSATVMWPLRSIEQNKFIQAARPEIIPTQKLTIGGNVLLEWKQQKSARDKAIECDFLCAALLDTPGVTSVTRVCEEGSATFRKGGGNPGTLVVPVEPQSILQKFARLQQDRQFHSRASMQEADRSIQSEWALRISRGEEIRRTTPMDVDAIDWTIKYERLQGKAQPQVERIEVRNRNGDVVARSSLVRHSIPGRLFWFGFDVGSSANGFASAEFTVGRSKVSNQARYYQFDSAVELLRTVSIPQPTPQPHMIAEAERALTDVLNNPVATESELLIAPMWLQQFRYTADHNQFHLIDRILSDDRIADPAHALRVALSGKADLTPLRAGLVQRYLNSRDPGAKAWYISSLVRLKDGTFAEPTENEQLIWRQALEVTEAAPFVERMADLGPDAVPQLMALLDQSLEMPWHARRQVLSGIREACKRLGPEAAGVIPRIQALIENSPTSLLNSRSDRREWLIALHLMGVGLSDLPLGLPTSESARLAAEFRSIQQQARRYSDRRQSAGS
ncbi:MAG: hypothetical protein R3C20_22940 [Planctomycetaceae bacterium]